MNFSVLSHVFLTNLYFLQVFNQMVLIFYCFSDLEDFWDDLLFSRLNYNALDDLPGSRLDFLEVVWTSWKSYGLPVTRLEVVWTSWEFSDAVIFHIKWNPSLSL
ncbi:hypothetical protein Bca101_084117 [Brassica carinata]